jgi:hypothetical protein
MHQQTALSPFSSRLKDGIVLESQNGDTTEGQNGSSDPAPETGPETAEPNPESIAPGRLD